MRQRRRHRLTEPDQVRWCCRHIFRPSVVLLEPALLRIRTNVLVQSPPYNAYGLLGDRDLAQPNRSSNYRSDHDANHLHLPAAAWQVSDILIDRTGDAYAYFTAQRTPSVADDDPTRLGSSLLLQPATHPCIGTAADHCRIGVKAAGSARPSPARLHTVVHAVPQPVATRDLRNQTPGPVPACGRSCPRELRHRLRSGQVRSGQVRSGQVIASPVARQS